MAPPYATTRSEECSLSARFGFSILSVGVNGPTCHRPCLWDVPAQETNPRPQNQPGSPETTAVQHAGVGICWTNPVPLEPPVRIELTTYSLRVNRSTNGAKAAGQTHGCNTGINATCFCGMLRIRPACCAHLRRQPPRAATPDEPSQRPPPYPATHPHRPTPTPPNPPAAPPRPRRGLPTPPPVPGEASRWPHPSPTKHPDGPTRSGFNIEFRQRA